MYSFFANTINSISRGGATIPIETNGLQLYLDVNMTESYSGSGTTWTDLSPNGFEVTLNGPTFVNSGGVKYLDFDGVNDTALCSTYTTALNMSTTGLAIGWWGRYTTTPSFLDTIVENVYTDPVSTNKITFGLDNRSTSNNGQGFGGGTYSQNDNNAFRPVNRSITLNTWKYWCMVTDVTSTTSATLRLYENGVQVGTNNISTNRTGGWNYYASDPVRFTIGCFLYGTSYSRYLDAGVGNVHVYNRELSATEVLSNFNATKSTYGL